MNIKTIENQYGPQSDWKDLSEGQIASLIFARDMYTLMLRFDKGLINIYGIRVHCYNHNFGHIVRANNFDEYYQGYVQPYLKDALEMTNAFLRIKKIPKPVLRRFMPDCYLCLSWDSKDVPENIGKVAGCGGMIHLERGFENNFVLAYDFLLDDFWSRDEKYLEPVRNAIYYIKTRVNRGFTVVNAIGGHNRHVNNFARYQKQIMLKGVFINNKLPNVTKDYLLQKYELLYGQMWLGNRFLKDEEKEHVTSTDISGVIIPRLYGDARNIYGDVTEIAGRIHPDLYGDISGLFGIIDNVTGNATGIRLDLNKWRRHKYLYFDAPIDLSELKKENVAKTINKYKTLSYKDNITLMKVWRTLCYHTIGLEQNVYDKFDHPVKVKPPFPVDRWGRYYEEHNNRMRIYSVNPADIMLAKDVNKCSSCFCINSGDNKWYNGMRCLISEITVNPNMGVAFEVFKTDMVKKLNQFNGIKFNWFDPDQACFFQYDKSHIKPFSGFGFLNDCEFTSYGIDDVVPIYGHDGICLDQMPRQRKLAFLETFIKGIYRWCANKERNPFPLVNNYQDFTMDDISDKWKEQIARANKMADELRAYLDENKEAK